MKIWVVHDLDAMDIIYASPSLPKTINKILTEYNERFGEEAVTVEEVEETGYYRMFGPVTVDL